MIDTLISGLPMTVVMGGLTGLTTEIFRGNILVGSIGVVIVFLGSLTIAVGYYFSLKALFALFSYTPAIPLDLAAMAIVIVPTIFKVIQTVGDVLS